MERLLRSGGSPSLNVVQGTGSGMRVWNALPTPVDPNALGTITITESSEPNTEKKEKKTEDDNDDDADDD